MEAVLLVALIIIFIVFLNAISSKINRLQDSFHDLNRKIDHLKKAVEQPTAPGEQVIVPKPRVIPETPAQPVAVPVPEQKIQKTTPAAAAAAPVPVVQKPKMPLPYKKSWWDNFKEQNPDLEKFIGENLINKIGILILVLGISYFVKFAIDKEWINEPARVGIGIMAGGIVMLVAHRLRKNYKAFSSVLVAGAVSIFYFTIAIAFHDYNLFGQTTAFIIMVGITAFSAFVTVSYDRMELAALTLTGGFAVPFMVSTGSGNYIVLLSYITILNLGILSIAYYKKWGFINLLSYIYTLLLYGGWLYTIIGTENAPYTGALAFGFIFYFLFILMNIIGNIKNRTAFSNKELGILVSSSFLFYAAGMIILENSWPGYKGLFTLLLGVFNFCFAWLLYKKLDMDQKVIYTLIGLTLTFITLAIPIQFEGNHITLFWAAEAVLLLWLAQKSGIKNFRFGSVIVHGLMLISLLMDWKKIYGTSEMLKMVFNPGFLTGLFSAASCFAVLLLLKKDTEAYTAFGVTFNPQGYSRFIKAVFILLIYFTGLIEVNHQGFYHLESIYAAFSLNVLYHLLFCAIVIRSCSTGKSNWAQKTGTRAGMFNIIAFILLFSQLAHYEIQDYLSGEIKSRLAYWVHMVSLAIIIYTAFLVYTINRDNINKVLRGRGLLPWLMVLFTVYLASSELMLHWLAMILEPFKGVSGSRGEEFITARESISTIRSQVIKTGYPVLWGILACLLLILGIRRELKPIRIAALVLLGLTIIKLFVFDIRNVSETGKIIAFILLGILILVISFVYQKIKLLVIENKPEINDSVHENKDI